MAPTYHELLIWFDWFDGDEVDVLIVLVGQEVPVCGFRCRRDSLHPVGMGQLRSINDVQGPAGGRFVSAANL